MKQFSVKPDALINGAKTFENGSQLLKGYANDINTLSQQLDSSFHEVKGVLENLATRVEEHSVGLHSCQEAAVSISGTYTKYEAEIVGRQKSNNAKEAAELIDKFDEEREKEQAANGNQTGKDKKDGDDKQTDKDKQTGDDKQTNNGNNEKADGLSDAGYGLLCAYESPYKKDCVYDENGNLVSLAIIDVGDGKYTIGFGNTIDMNDAAKIAEYEQKYGIKIKVGEQIDIETCRKIYNDNVGYYKNVTDALFKRTGYEPTQQEYDALFVAVYNRPALASKGGTLEKLITSGSRDPEEWKNAIMTEYHDECSGLWADNHKGWENRTLDELELYFNGDYERTH